MEYILTQKLFCGVTGRPSKSTLAIVEKLRRQHTRLSQIQDIAGCRIIVKSIPEQDALIEQASAWLPRVVIDDKRESPTHGYRAVHLIVEHHAKFVEVQIRTVPQHFLAEMSEKIAESYGQEIKYGAGAAWALELLEKLGSETATLDRLLARKIALTSGASAASRGLSRRDMQKKIEYMNSKVRHSMYRARVLLHQIDNRQEQ